MKGTLIHRERLEAIRDWDHPRYSTGVYVTRDETSQMAERMLSAADRIREQYAELDRAKSRIGALEQALELCRDYLELCRDYSAKITEEFYTCRADESREVGIGYARFWAARRISEAMKRYADAALHVADKAQNG